MKGMKLKLGDFLYKSGTTFQIRRINEGRKNTTYGVERLYTWAPPSREPIPFNAGFNEIIYLSYNEILKNFDSLQRNYSSSGYSPFPLRSITLSQISIIASREFLIEKDNLIHRRKK